MAFAALIPPVIGRFLDGPGSFQRMNQTAILHMAATGLTGAGIVTGGLVRDILFALAVTGFIGGIVISRRGSSDGPPDGR